MGCLAFRLIHYQRDVWRVNQIRNLDQVVGVAAADFADASLWEEAKKGDAAIMAMIDDGLKNTAVTVVCIGGATAGRKYIDYEISQSIARSNTDTVRATPAKVTGANAKIYKYVDQASLKKWIEDAATAAGK